MQQQLELKPLGTRIVTYYGSCAEVPECYTCIKTAYDGTLKPVSYTHLADAQRRRHTPKAFPNHPARNVVPTRMRKSGISTSLKSVPHLSGKMPRGPIVLMRP